MPPGMEFANNSCTTADKPHLTFLTYDQVPYPHHLTRVIHTSDFIYRGPALETSLLEQASSQTHLFNLAIGRGIAGTFSPILLNAPGISAEPAENDVLADSVHGDCAYVPYPAGSVQQVNLQDWVNGNLKGEHLDTAFWAPLVRLLEYVKERWMEKDHGQAQERKCYELTVRAIKFGHGQGLMETQPFWHTEWWYPRGWQRPDSPVTAEDHSYEQPHFNVDRTPTREPLPQNRSSTHESMPERFTQDHESTTSPGRNYAAHHLSGTFTPPSSPARLPSIPCRPDHATDQVSASPTPPVHVGIPTDEAKAHEAPAIRVMAQLAGDGTLFTNDPFSVAALASNSSDGIGHAVRASRERELVFWSVEDGRKGYGPVYAAPPMGVFQQVKGELVGDDRVFVSLVVGTEEQVRKMGSGLFGKGR